MQPEASFDKVRVWDARTREQRICFHWVWRVEVLWFRRTDNCSRSGPCRGGHLRVMPEGTVPDVSMVRRAAGSNRGGQFSDLCLGRERCPWHRVDGQ